MPQSPTAPTPNPHETATKGWSWASRVKETSHLSLARNILHQSLSSPHPCVCRNPRHPLKGAVPMGDGWDEGTRVRASLRNNKRREGEGREGQKIENKVPAGGLKAPSSSCFQGHHLPHGECLAKPLSPRAGHAPLLPLGRSPPSQDGNPQHSQLAPSLTTLPLSHEQRRSCAAERPDQLGRV